MKCRTWAKTVLAMALAGSAFGADAADARLSIAAGEKPVRVSWNVAIGERPLREVWDASFKALHAWHDRNDDGKLDEAEAVRLPAAYALREVLGIGFTPKLGEAPAWAELDKDKSGGVDVAEMSAWYRERGLGSPLIGVGVLPERASLNAALVKLLDADSDGQATPNEIERAASAIEKFDRNSDELIGAGELVAGVFYPGAAGSHLLTPSGQRPEALEKFPVERLSLVATADDADWRVQLRCSHPPGKAPVFGITNDKKAAAPSLVKTWPGLQVVVRGDQGHLAATSASLRERLVTRFQDDDANRDEFLDSAELEKDEARGFWTTFLGMLDRNADEKIALKELQGWLDLQEQLGSGHVLVSILDAEQGLFELLDETHDGALSAQELRGAKEKLTTAGALDAKSLDLAKLPRLILITISQGYPRSPLGSADAVGPAWFLAMDRNLDGEVSRAEFVGPADAFRKLDADSNGALSAEEATK